MLQNATVRGEFADLIEGGAPRGGNLYHSFSEFNVGEGQRVYFANPSGIANILGRVTGNDVSDIMGVLGVDGGANLFLLNPNGIIFGPNAQLDVSGSFVGSAADSFAFPDGSEFSAARPQSPSLLSVNVPLGVQWGAAQAGPVINNANLSVEQGKTLTLFGGDLTSTGSLLAPGGTVEVLGQNVRLLDSADIDVSSPTGGGIVLIGGDYQGQGATPRATNTLVGPDVTINANAETAGNGGKVIIWADQATQFYGSVSARGGSQIGNGGFVEISSPRALVFQGAVDTTAPNGTIGTLLIDPTNITIVSTGGNTTDPNLMFEDPPTEALINASTINNSTSNIILQATNNITFNDSIKITQGEVGLTAEAGGIIQVNENISTNRGDIRLTGSDIEINDADIGFSSSSSVPGEIMLTATGQAVGSQGNITLNSASVASNTNNPKDALNVELYAEGDIKWLCKINFTFSAQKSLLCLERL